ncbi:PucR family transcriptional regulator [Leucobacter japonicus]|uniref:PucR family transcriptional regulator n=1 Tax=Leucobacter japonicus TaxID=1461259 RepID=UPI0006A7C1A7|nr:PucR family transcriptional regulator [Leucobacter japonicus]
MHETPDSQPADAPAVTVAEALALAEVQAGAPELVAGAAGLERPIRWAHVVAGAGAFALLEGGELLLSTGAGWPADHPGLEALAAQVVAADPAAVVLEFGAHIHAAPAELIAVCEAHAIPLIVLHREVRFVQITQRVHQRVLAAQTEALAARAEVHTMLTELGLNRSPVDYVVERLAESLDAPVVLEDSAGRVVAWAGGDLVPQIALAPWAAASAPVQLPADTESVSVEAQGKRWGRLSALAGPPHPAGRRTVLELGAFALALGKLADPDGEQWLQLSSRRLFDALLTGRYRSEAELGTQLAAAGLPIRERITLGATLRGTGDFGGHATLERALLETALRRAVAPEGRVILVPDPAEQLGVETEPGRTPLLALLSFPLGDARVTESVEGAAAPPLAARLARELEMLVPTPTPGTWRAHLGLGAPGRSLRSLITSLERVRASGRLAPTAATGRVTVQQAERQALAYLVRGLSASPEVQEFASDALGPLIAHDAASGPGHSGDLLDVLRAYLEHPTNRSLAAQRARLSRSVFYQRLALIEELLGVDLADGTTIATLTVALLARSE